MRNLRKMASLIISILIIATLCTGIVFAESSDQKEEKIPKNIQSTGTLQKTMSKAMNEVARKSAKVAQGTLQVSDINTGKSPISSTEARNTIVMPTSGVLIMYYTGSTPDVKKGTTKLQPRDYASRTVDGVNVYVRTFQVGKDSYIAERSYGNGIMAFQYAPAAGANLTNNKIYIGGSCNDAQILYYKTQASAKGTIKVGVKGEMSTTSMYKVKLFNASKKPLSSEWETLSNSNKNTTIFGVKKGTYYVGVIPYGSAHSSVYDIVTQFTKRAVDAAGTSKKKAKSIKLGQTKRGIMYISPNNMTQN